MTKPDGCTRWKEILTGDEPDRAEFELHVATCPDCSRSLGRVASMTSELVRWTSSRPATFEKSPTKLEPLLAERSRLDLLLAGFFLSFLVLEHSLEGGGIRYSSFPKFFLVSAAVAAALIALRWFQRRALLRSFATETLVMHFAVEVRKAQRRAWWLIAFCIAVSTLLLTAIRFGLDLPGPPEWYRQVVIRGSALALWPAVFAVYTYFRTMPRLTKLRTELERG